MCCMADACTFCGGSDGAIRDTNMGRAHGACRDELSRRLNADACTVCGEPLDGNRARYAQQNHPGCHGAPGSYRGYPGGM